MKKPNFRAISTALAVIVVVLIIVISSIGTYAVLNNQKTQHTSVYHSTNPTTQGTVSYYTTISNGITILSGGGCSLSNATVYTNAPVKVLSVGAWCSSYTTSVYNSQSSTNSQETLRLLNFNMTLENQSNITLTAQVGFYPTLSFLGISFGANNGLIGELSEPLCTVTTATSSVTQNAVATASFPSCFDGIWYYVAHIGSVTVSLNPSLHSSNYASVARVNATLTVT